MPFAPNLVDARIPSVTARSRTTDELCGPRGGEARHRGLGPLKPKGANHETSNLACLRASASWRTVYPERCASRNVFVSFLEQGPRCRRNVDHLFRDRRRLLHRYVCQRVRSDKHRQRDHLPSGWCNPPRSILVPFRSPRAFLLRFRPSGLRQRDGVCLKQTDQRIWKRNDTNVNLRRE